MNLGRIGVVFSKNPLNCVLVVSKLHRVRSVNDRMAYLRCVGIYEQRLIIQKNAEDGVEFSRRGSRCTRRSTPGYAESTCIGGSVGKRGGRYGIFEDRP